MANEELPRRDPQASGGHKHQQCAQGKELHPGKDSKGFVGNAGKWLWLDPVFVGLGMWRDLHSLRIELVQGDQQGLGTWG